MWGSGKPFLCCGKSNRQRCEPLTSWIHASALASSAITRVPTTEIPAAAAAAAPAIFPRNPRRCVFASECTGKLLLTNVCALYGSRRRTMLRHDVPYWRYRKPPGEHDSGAGRGDGGLGIGDGGLGGLGIGGLAIGGDRWAGLFIPPSPTTPPHQSPATPIPNPQSPIPNPLAQKLMSA